MENKSKNSPIVIAILLACFALAIYILATKIFGSTAKEETNTAQANQPTTALAIDSLFEDDTAAKKQIPTTEIPGLSETEKPSKLEKLPSIDDLEKEMKWAIARIDKNLDQAYNFKPEDAKRQALLNLTEKIIDSVLAKGDNAFMHASKGDLYMLMGQNQKAVLEYALALKKLGNITAIKQNYASACYNVAIDQIENNDTDLAIAYLERFYNIIPEDVNGSALLLSWYKKRAVGLLRKEENEQGLVLLKKALLITSTDHVVHFNAGIAYYRMLRLDKSLFHFKTCIDLNPEDNFSKNYLFTIYSQKGDSVNAAKYQTEATQITVPIK